VAFLLEGVAGESAFNQADGIHPNEKGHRRIAENLAGFFKPVLARRDSSAANAPR
jgi:acyl-CoA thioesterase-1